MLQTNRQNDYSEFDFEFFKNNYNNNLINLANIQLNLLNTMPSNVDFISKLADKLSNLIVISGNCFYYKTSILDNQYNEYADAVVRYRMMKGFCNSQDIAWIANSD